MPKLRRVCQTPGCLQEGEPVTTGLTVCIHCRRTMDVVPMGDPDMLRCLSELGLKPEDVDVEILWPGWHSPI